MVLLTRDNLAERSVSNYEASSLKCFNGLYPILPK